MLICQTPGCGKLAWVGVHCKDHQPVKKAADVRPIRDPRNAILAIMTGDKLRIGDSPTDVVGVVYEVTSIEGDSQNAQIYLRDEKTNVSRVIHYIKVD